MNKVLRYLWVRFLNEVYLMKSWHSTRENSFKLTVSDLIAYKIGCSESVWKRNLYESQKGMDDLEAAVFQRVVGDFESNSRKQ